MIHCFHPDCAACVKFLYASLVFAMIFYMIVSTIIVFTRHQWCIWLKDVFTSIDRWVSLSLSLSLTHTYTHTRTHTRTHAQVGPIELFICSWQLLIRFHCNLTFFLKLLIELSDFKKLYRSLVWAFPASLNVGWVTMLGCTVLHRPFFQHQQCNWADSCTQYPGQLVILRPAGLQTFLGGMH